MVPPKPSPAAPAASDPQAGLANLSKAASAAPKLSINAAAHAPAAHPSAAPQAAAFQARLNQARVEKKKPWVKWVIGGVVAIVCAIAGYIGYGYYASWQAKRDEAAKAAAAPPVPTNASPNDASAPKDLPVLPALWTLNLEDAKIPEGKANGMLAGTNFMVETAQFDRGGATYLLRMEQGASTSPDLQVKIYLQLAPTESPTGHVWSVSQDMKGKGVPQIIKLWKPNPRVAAQQKLYNSGYAMKLELGDISGGMVSGKIYLALPDKEQSVVAGLFKANTTLTGAPAGVVATPTAAPGPRPPPNPQGAAFDQRYGKKR